MEPLMTGAFAVLVGMIVILKFILPVAGVITGMILYKKKSKKLDVLFVL